MAGLLFQGACIPGDADEIGKRCSEERPCGQGYVCAEELCARSTRELVSSGSTWRYLASASAPPADWMAPSFDDSSWPTGKGPFGYNNELVVTTVSYGPDSAHRYPTTYFRFALELSADEEVRWLRARVLRDDGVVVYLNGQEAFRSNMAPGPVSYGTFASGHTGPPDETTYLLEPADAGLLVSGRNVIAAEVHQETAGSSDLVFDLRIVAGE